MNTITVLLPKISDPKTGGQKYDTYLVKKLNKIHKEFIFITDEKLKLNSSIAFFYNIIYFFELKKILKTKIFITNSRMYPRLFFLIKVLKLFNRDIKLIVIHHHYNYHVHSGVKKLIHKYLEVNFLNEFSNIIIPSRYVKDTTEKLLPKKKIYFLEIGFENYNKEKEDKVEQVKNLLCVGTIEPRKGVHLLIDALKDIKVDYILNVIGNYNKNDKYYLSLIERISNYKLEEKIVFSGRVSNEELFSYFSNADIFVFPSLHEGYGMVMVEAMQFGLPVIAFNNSSIPYIVKDDYNGLIAQNNDSKDLGKKIEYLLKNKDELKRLVINIKKDKDSIRKLSDLNKDIKEFYNHIINT